MIINTMAYMLIISLLGMLRLRIRYDKLLSWGMFFSVAYLFGVYCQQSFTGTVYGFSLLWEETQIGNITLDFNPTAISNQIILPIFFISLLVILNNNIFRYEERRCLFNSFIIMNLISLCLIISATNYVQLITMIFISDIIGYLILKNVDSSHRYAIYNFFADMCLFMILALACGKIQSIDITRLLGYEQIGRHKDFVGLMIALSLFIKLGCFPFQNYLQDISSARFHRTIAVNMLGTPLVGMLVLIKLHNLLFVSDIALPIYKIITILTFLVGIAGFILQVHIQKKIINLNMAFIGIMLQLLLINDFNWDFSFGMILIGIYLFNHLFFEIYIYQDRETNITDMASVNGPKASILKILLFRETLLSCLFIILLWNMSFADNNWLVIAGGIIIFIAMSIILHHIYVSPKKSNLMISGIKSRSWHIIPGLINLILLALGYKYINPAIWLIILLSTIFLVLIASPLGKFFHQFYNKKGLQDNNLSKNFFLYTIVSPLTYLSRISWLFVDVIISEKIITSFISMIEKGSHWLFSKTNRYNYKSSFMFIIIGIGIAVLYYIGGQK
ncbi:MAG: hypothetical protein J6W96_03295 [Alphaproteobacteria bacterium]|nr:hypothetical protein [Alphaproteobacteria bacterium]